MGRPITVDHSREADKFKWLSKQHQDEANDATEKLDHRIAGLHTRASDSCARAMKIHNSAVADPTKSKEAIDAGQTAIDHHLAAQEASYGCPVRTFRRDPTNKAMDKNPWTIYSHAFDVKKKDMGKSSQASKVRKQDKDINIPHDPSGKMGRAVVVDREGTELKLHPKSEFHGEIRHPKTNELHGTYRWSTRNGQKWLMAKPAKPGLVYEGDEKQLGKATSLEAIKGLKSTALHELHHPRTSSQTREAIDHLSSHKDNHTPKEQAALEERVRRAAKKHGVSMAESKNPEAAKRSLERKAKMANKSIEKAYKAISDLQRGMPEGQCSEKAEPLPVRGGPHPFQGKGGAKIYTDVAKKPQEQQPAMNLAAADKALSSPVPQPVPTLKACSDDAKDVSKAMTAASMPRIPRALMNDTYRSATAVITRNHSSIAKDIHTGPLTDQVILDVQEEERRRTRMPMYKSCNCCGRTYMAKGLDDPCPTCSVNKSQYCPACKSHLVKGNGGITCPLCG